MIRLLVKSMNVILALLIILSLIVVFLLATTPGLFCVIELSRLYLPGTLKIDNIEGSLIQNFNLEGLEYQDNALRVKIKKLNVQWHPHSLQENQQVIIKWNTLLLENEKNKIIASKNGAIAATGILPKLKVNLNAQAATNINDNLNLKAKIDGVLPWQWTFDANLTQPQLPSQNTILATNLSLKGNLTAKNQGKLILTINPGFFHVPNNDSIPIVHFKDGTLKVVLSPEKLKGSGMLVIDEHKNLNLEFQLPKFALDTGLTDRQLINGKLLLTVDSLDFLEKMSPEINKLKGQIAASLTINGTLKKNNIESQLMISNTSFSIPTLGLDLERLELNVRSKEKLWEAMGSIISAGHPLVLSGKGTLSPELTGNFLVEGNDFPLINTSEYQIHISPKLNLHLAPTTRSLSGTILVPFALIQPRSFQNSISLSEDVVYKHKEKSAPTFTFLNSIDIAVEMGKDVAINVKGLKGFLDGILHIKQFQEGSMNAHGELSVRKGTYKAYGQDLVIKQGQLIFTGGPIDNPGITLRAAKKISTSSTTLSSSSQLLDFNSTNMQNINYGETMLLGVEVSGRLTQPKIQLFSEPATLSQADILSMLVLGRPANQATKSGGQLLLTAISSMNLGSSTENLRLLEQLKQNAGIDFNVQTNTNYNQTTQTTNDSTSFMVGKSLSKRLYLSYNIGLSQTDTNMLTLRYLLNKFFSIQISNSDTSSAIDFLYTSRKKKSHQKNHTSRKIVKTGT